MVSATFLKPGRHEPHHETEPEENYVALCSQHLHRGSSDLGPHSPTLLYFNETHAFFSSLRLVLPKF